MILHHRTRSKGLFKRLPGITNLGIVILISSMAFASISTILAVYINSFVNNDAIVGFITALFVGLPL